MTIAMFFIYIAVVILISWWAYRKTSVSEDYYLGGRGLSASTAALSAGASDMSGWLLLGLPGYAMVSGLESIWLSIGLCSGLALCWLSLACRIRIYTEFLDNALTIPQYLQRRFMAAGALIRVLPAVIILFFFLFYVSSGFVAGAKLFDSIFSVGYTAGVVVTCIFMVIYTMVGGFLAVSWTDVLQGLLMLLALCIAPVMVIVANGGWDNTWSLLDMRHPALLDPFTNNVGESLGSMAIISLLGWGLGYFGQPHILARFKGMRSATDVPKAAAIGVGWSLVVNVGAIAVGLLAVVAFSQNNIQLADDEQVFILLTQTIFHPVIAGILLAAILAAIMSTADSQLLVCSSALAEDLATVFPRLGAVVKPMILARIGVLIIGLLAMMVAMDPNSRVLDIVSYAWAGLGAALGPVLLVSVYSGSMSRVAAIGGMVVGGVTVVIWKNIGGGIFDLYELVPGFVCSLAAIIGLTYVKPADDALVEQFRVFSAKLIAADAHKIKR